MSLWCVVWLIINSINYFRLTWHIFATLKWGSFLLLISLCFWIWLLVFGSSVWAPLNFVLLSWAKSPQKLNRLKIGLLITLTPMLLGLALMYVGPYFYPVLSEGEGKPLTVRILPIFGGKGFN